MSTEITIINDKIEELKKEYKEVGEKLQQINIVRSQFQTRLVQIDGILVELNEILKNIKERERPINDTECEVEEGSDSDKTRNNKNM